MKILFFILFITLASSKPLKIAIFDIGNADSQLIIFPSGYSILIDAGDSSGSYGEAGKNGKYLAKRIEALLGHKKIDVMVLTHYHVDHMGGYKKGGFWYLVEKKGFTVGKFLKRNAGTYKGSSMSGCSKSKVTWKYVGKIAESSAKFLCYATGPNMKTKLSKVAENAHRCNDKQITPPDAGAKVTVLIRDALGVKQNNGKKLSRNSMKEKVPVGENDFSICMRIQYGDFVYATCGDLSGYEYTYSDGTYAYHDVETSVAPMMGEVDLLKVNHHGSKSASNTKWCKTLKPTVSVITCNASSHPQSRPMKNLNAVGTYFYTTGTKCKQSEVNKYKNLTEMGDDVIITYTKGDKTFKVENSAGKKAKTFNIKTNKTAPKTCVKLEN